MKAVPRALYLFCFMGLAIVAVLALNRVLQPSAATVLVRTVFVAALCGAPGLLHRRLWPLAIALLPIGCYLLIRTIVPLPVSVDGTAAQYSFYTQQLQTGASAYKTAVFPLPLNEAPELRLLVVFVTYWLLGVAAFVALTMRRPLPAIVVVLTILGFSVTVDASVRLLWAALLFVILAGCLFVLSRALDREGWRLRETIAGAGVAAVAALLALGLLVAVPSVVANPWQDWRAWDPFNRGDSVYTFNWLQNYPKLLDPGQNRLVMTVESPYQSYWRASSLDTFTGTAWVTSRAFLVPIEPLRDDQEFRATSSVSYGPEELLYLVPPDEPTPPGATVLQAFELQGARTNYFFVGGDPLALTFSRELPLRMNDMRALHVSTELPPPIRYSVTAVVPQLRPADLVGLGTDYPEDLDGYLTLPFSRLADIPGPDKAATWRATVGEESLDGREWVGLYDLNQRVVGDATDPYQITLRIERHLRRFYKYELAPSASDITSPYAAFLFDNREGYCQHFAGAMAVLLRFNSIPARVAVGFTSGEEEEEGSGLYRVTSNNAHAWVEAYFPTVGWVAFDPTPGRNLPPGSPSSSTEGFEYPFVDSTTPDGSGGTLPTLPNDLPGRTDTGGGGFDVTERGWLSRASWLPWVAGFVVVVVGWPAARALWRRRRLHRGTSAERLQASLGLLRSDVSSYGVAASPSATLEDVLVTLQTHIGLEPDLAFVERADAVLFGGRNARTNDVRKAETLRREVKTRLRKRHGWLRTGLAWYGLPRLI
ncbi:MAG: transglutaminase domain-containing protein [Thermoleophilia bacterium]|nr:transglutaminase domain-containing protein [Thermoleophilia bacterium]